MDRQNGCKHVRIIVVMERIEEGRVLMFEVPDTLTFLLEESFPFSKS